MEDCIFCKIVRGELPCFKIYEDENVLSFLDINPVTHGHSLVIPKRHAENIWKLQAEDLKAVIAGAKVVAEKIKKVINPTGVVMLQLNGRGVNQVVMHYHIHLIPRSQDEPPLPMSSWELRKGDFERLKALGEVLFSA